MRLLLCHPWDLINRYKLFPAGACFPEEWGGLRKRQISRPPNAPAPLCCALRCSSSTLGLCVGQSGAECGHAKSLGSPPKPREGSRESKRRNGIQARLKEKDG
ncbi:hypothetical protein XENORESO_005608 [Xenotaenia resolanae]|uniref:Uncharacterized protein n=1 Tax=Xenotaenia resolanae TaxID=208358 RepID=A0ABV0WG44_9TELE